MIHGLKLARVASLVAISMALTACGGGSPATVAPRPALGQTGGGGVLYSFAANGSDGIAPLAGLVMDSSGNLYGTTSSGGAGGNGTVFKITAAGSESVLYSFGTDDAGIWSANPQAGLVMDAGGNLYGTATTGGAKGYGAVFQITPGGNESVVYSFAGTPDGANPLAGLVMDASGNLYGTTGSGGANGNGTVFKVTPAGVATLLHSFAAQWSTSDGGNPQAGLVLDASGNLYGTTFSGGAFVSGGTVFKVTPAGVETTLHSFGASLSDGFAPQAGLVMDGRGNLYGTTGGGGATGNGTVFKITPAGSASLIYSFGGGADGSGPKAGLVIDASGNLYGTTYMGGASGNGTVFKVTPAGVESVLYSFGAAPDGAYPQGGLVMDARGNLYGTTSAGGASGAGTVFRIAP